jgi:F-type H+-transporting ATPase subunit epsilon
MSSFAFSIISPRGKTFEGTIASVSAPGLMGGFGVLAGHAPMIAAVQPGVTTVHGMDKIEYFFTGDGVLEVSHQETLMLVDEAEKVEGVEAAKALIQQRRDKMASAAVAAKGNA